MKTKTNKKGHETATLVTSISSAKSKTCKTKAVPNCLEQNNTRLIFSLHGPYEIKGTLNTGGIKTM